MIEIDMTTTNFAYSNLIYTTRKDKKIKVYFFSKGTAWFQANELKVLFDVSEESIINCIDNMKETEYPTDKSRYVELKVAGKDEIMGFFNWGLVQLIGEKLNPLETQDLIRWINMMIGDYPKEHSKEFLENLKKAAKYDPSSEN